MEAATGEIRGHPTTIQWVGDMEGHVRLIDQTRLPAEFVELDIESCAELASAIRRLAVRGAPAIGVAVAYGVCLSTRGLTDAGEIEDSLSEALSSLRDVRPTAVNLRHMIDRMAAVVNRSGEVGVALRERLLWEAQAIHEEDRELCRRIGDAGAELIHDGMAVLTHCNAGALATGGSGTALSVLYEAKRRGRRFQVFADETRPLLQGARLTAWEVVRSGIPVTVLPDSAAGSLLARGGVDLVITGADRVVANGDAANKIGTHSLACLARHHEVPFYIAAPSTTFDLELASGGEIPIEERDADEVLCTAGWQRTEQDLLSAYNPAFDVTPAQWITGWITEEGILRPPFHFHS